MQQIDVRYWIQKLISGYLLSMQRKITNFITSAASYFYPEDKPVLHQNGLRLPKDIQLHTLGYLDPQALACFASTNKENYNLSSHNRISARHYSPQLFRKYLGKSEIPSKIFYIAKILNSDCEKKLNQKELLELYQQANDLLIKWVDDFLSHANFLYIDLFPLLFAREVDVFELIKYIASQTNLNPKGSIKELVDYHVMTVNVTFAAYKIFDIFSKLLAYLPPLLEAYQSNKITRDALSSEFEPMEQLPVMGGIFIGLLLLRNIFNLPRGFDALKAGALMPRPPSLLMDCLLLMVDLFSLFHKEEMNFLAENIKMDLVEGRQEIVSDEEYLEVKNMVSSFHKDLKSLFASEIRNLTHHKTREIYKIFAKQLFCNNEPASDDKRVMRQHK